MKKNNLKKVALLGLAGGLMLSAQGHAEVAPANQADTTLLTANCGAGSCGSHKQKRNTNTASRGGCGAQHSPSGSSYYSERSGCGAPSNRQTTQNEYYSNPNSANPQFDRSANPQFDRSNSYNNSPYTSNAYDPNRGNQDQQWEMSESDLFAQINDQSKALYRGLDEAGKKTARQLAAQSSYVDKNQAVKDAAAQQPAMKQPGKY